jgi:hypothetical protein
LEKPTLTPQHKPLMPKFTKVQIFHTNRNLNQPTKENIPLRTLEDIVSLPILQSLFDS